MTGIIRYTAAAACACNNTTSFRYDTSLARLIGKIKKTPSLHHCLPATCVINYVPKIIII